MSKSRYKVQPGGSPHFLTSTIVGWLPAFTRPQAAQVILESLYFLQEHERLTVFGYDIMENHLHLIAASQDLAKELDAFKSYTARRIIDLLIEWKDGALLQQLSYYKERHKADREHQFWQEGNHPQEIRGDAMMRQKLDYMHGNPVRRGYVDNPIHWRYSSARNYEGLPGLIPVTTEW